MLRDIEVTCADAIHLGRSPFGRSVIHMQTTSMQSPAQRGRTLLRTARAVRKWFSRAVNAIGQPYANPDASAWTDWPRFPPF
jgi:hypothetical protein